MNRDIVLVIALSVSVLLSVSCTIVPGSRLYTYDKAVSGEAQNDISKLVDVFPITIDLLKEMRSSQEPPRPNHELDVAIENYTYRIGKGDVLNIVVYEHSELTIPAGEYRSAQESGNVVKENGFVYFPYIGNVSVVGKTLEQAREIIARKLSEYLEAPFVDVLIVGFNSKRIYITGAVRTPGIQEITNIPLTLVEAINRAGGLNEDADWHRVTVTRVGGVRTVSLQAILQHGVLTENVLLEANDIVHVPRNDALKVFVMGMVKNPGTVKIGRVHLTLAEALSSTGGIDENAADASGIFIVRGKDENGKIANIYQLNIKDAAAMVLGAEFKLEPYDVVYVTAAPVEIWNRVVRSLLPTLQAYDYWNRSLKIE